jgi:hypothetical protein
LSTPIRSMAGLDIGNAVTAVNANIADSEDPSIG